MDTNFKAKVNDHLTFDLTSEDISQLDILQTSRDELHILKEGKPYLVEILKSNFQSKEYVVKVNKATYRIEISDALDQLINEMGFAVSSSQLVAFVEAPMPGLILEIQVKNGQEVSEGDPLLILEAMKMENVITSPRDGVIKKVTMAKGNTVDKKDILIEFE